MGVLKNLHMCFIYDSVYTINFTNLKSSNILISSRFIPGMQKYLSH